ncbi:MAG: hypothetical protein ACE5JQ_04250 [Candidatus Methylomirabilales bacterium]
MATQTFGRFSDLVKSHGIRFYGKYAEQDEVPLEAIEAHLLERYGEAFLGIEDCQKLVAFALFYVRSKDLEWYRVLMLDEAFRPLTASGTPPPPVASPEEIVPLIHRAGVSPEQVRRMALVGFAFSVWLTSDQVRQAVAMCESSADAEALQGLIETEMESDPEPGRWE